MIIEAQPPPTFLDAEEVRSRADLVALLEADGVKVIGSGRRRMARCPLHGDKSPSFSVDTQEGLWHCFAGCGGGNVFNYVMKRDGCDFLTALERVAAFAGIRATDRPPVIRMPRPLPAPLPPFVPESMPADVAAGWREGVEFLQGSPTAQAEIAAERGWSVELVEELAADEVIGSVDYYGRRCPAFPVMLITGRHNQMQIGVHLRVSRGDGWRFYPNGKTHSRSIPPVPFILGQPAGARLVVILEGQWDALCFSYLAGWLGRGAAGIPSGVVVLGVRGKNGTGPLLDHVARWLPRDASCLLLPDIDRDKHGKPVVLWREPGGFREQLQQRFGRVVDATIPGGHKDFNDALRAGAVWNEQIQHLISKAMDHDEPHREYYAKHIERRFSY